MARAPPRAYPPGAASAGASGSARANRRSCRSRKTLPHGVRCGQAELAPRGTLEVTHQLMATEEELLEDLHLVGCRVVPALEREVVDQSVAVVFEREPRGGGVGRVVMLLYRLPPVLRVL